MNKKLMFWFTKLKSACHKSTHFKKMWQIYTLYFNFTTFFNKNNQDEYKN